MKSCGLAATSGKRTSHKPSDGANDLECILDTDHLGILQRVKDKHYEVLVNRIAKHSQVDFYVTIISFHEQILGWNAYIARAREKDGVIRGYWRLERILFDFADAQVLSFDEGAASAFDDLRRQRIRIGTMDLRIASIALANDMTLLTRNQVDFERVPRLTIEDWTLGP